MYEDEDNNNDTFYQDEDEDSNNNIFYQDEDGDEDGGLEEVREEEGEVNQLANCDRQFVSVFAGGQFLFLNF